MDIETIIKLILTALTLLFGALSAYFCENQKLKNSAVKYIAEAEELYKGSVKAGGVKFTWVVDALYNLVPVPFRIIITKKLIEAIVQSTFDSIESYAKMQLDKAVNSIIDKEDKENDDK